tara:strand:+ start:1221 stop:1403 length:183 start_codon:yes stop_codon:yes gene_type:complete
MLKNIIDLLQLDDFLEESYNIQVAKGLYAMPKGFKEAYKQKKREQVLKKRLKQWQTRQQK